MMWHVCENRAPEHRKGVLHPKECDRGDCGDYSHGHRYAFTHKIPPHYCPTQKCVNYGGEHRSTQAHEEPIARNGPCKFGKDCTNTSDEHRYAYFHE